MEERTTERREAVRSGSGSSGVGSHDSLTPGGRRSGRGQPAPAANHARGRSIAAVANASFHSPLQASRPQPQYCTVCSVLSHITDSRTTHPLASRRPTLNCCRPAVSGAQVSRVPPPVVPPPPPPPQPTHDHHTRAGVHSAHHEEEHHPFDQAPYMPHVAQGLLPGLAAVVSGQRAWPEGEPQSISGRLCGFQP